MTGSVSVELIGDSITVQYAPFVPHYVGAALDVRSRTHSDDYRRASADWDVPRGANAGTSTSLRARLAKYASTISRHASIVGVNVGLHDIKKVDGVVQTPIGRYLENLGASVELLRAAGLQVVWMTITPIDDALHNSAGLSFTRCDADVNAYNAAAQTVMREMRVPVIDVGSRTRELRGSLYVDHAHFTSTARHEQARFVGAGLLKIFGREADDDS